MTREQMVGRTFVELADSLVESFDLVDLLTVLSDRCVELVDAESTGILLADADGNLRVMAASSEQARLLELFQLQSEEGPCLEAYSTGAVVACEDLSAAAARWPRFAAESLAAGFHSIYALPLRVRHHNIGALNLFRAGTEPMPAEDLTLAQAMADVASIAIIQDEALRHSEFRAGQLQNALDSRVAIEQAKGVLAERQSIDMDEAFRRLRTYARSNNQGLTSVAIAVVHGAIRPDAVVS